MMNLIIDERAGGQFMADEDGDIYIPLENAAAILRAEIAEVWRTESSADPNERTHYFLD